MFVKKAWGFTSKKEIGLKSFDSVHRISIDIMSERYQSSVFIGNSKSTLYNRQAALEAIGDSALSEKIRTEIRRNPSSEYAYYAFSYPSPKGSNKFFECLIKTREPAGLTIEVTLAKRLCDKTIGFMKSLTACRTLIETLVQLHTLRSDTEMLARTINCPVIRASVKQKIQQANSPLGAETLQLFIDEACHENN